MYPNNYIYSYLCPLSLNSCPKNTKGPICELVELELVLELQIYVVAIETAKKLFFSYTKDTFGKKKLAAPGLRANSIVIFIWQNGQNTNLAFIAIQFISNFYRPQIHLYQCKLLSRFIIMLSTYSIRLGSYSNTTLYMSQSSLHHW